MNNDPIARIRAARHTEQMANPIAYNDYVRDAWMPLWVRGAGRSYHAVEQVFKRQTNADLGQAPKGSGPAIVVGSGPSLDDAFPELQNWKGAIFCSTSQLNILARWDIVPDYCVLIDCDPHMFELIEHHDERTALITHPQIPREYLERWRGKVYFFRLYDPGDQFSTKYLPMIYAGLHDEPGKDRGIGAYVMNAGNVVNTCLPIAVELGYRPLFLMGYDLGYPDNQYRFTNWQKNGTGWEKLPDPGIPEGRPTMAGNNGVTTDELGCFYKQSFMIYYGATGSPVISCSRGILSEVPYQPAKEVIARQGQGFPLPDPQETYRKCQAYLRARHVWLLTSPFGLESVNIFGTSIFNRALVALRHWRYEQPWFLALRRWRALQQQRWTMRKHNKTVDRGYDAFFDRNEKTMVYGYVEQSGVDRRDLVRMALDQFMSSHPPAELRDKMKASASAQ